MFPCHSLQVIFFTIKFPPLPGCHLLPFHSLVQTCCFCSTPHVRCMRDCCQPRVTTGNRQAIRVASCQEGALLRRLGWQLLASRGARKKWGYHIGAGSNQVNRATPSPDVSLLCPWHRGVGAGEKRGSQPCKKDRVLPPSLWVQCNRKKKILILVAINCSWGC